MNIGMLWFDNNTKEDLDTKVRRAALYYQEKYGRMPTLCFVHPSMLPDRETDKAINRSSQEVKVQSSEVVIRSNQSVLPNHFWIGVNGRHTSSS
jgi:poly(A) polymerase Pap1